MLIQCNTLTACCLEHECVPDCACARVLRSIVPQTESDEDSDEDDGRVTSTRGRPAAKLSIATGTSRSGRARKVRQLTCHLHLPGLWACLYLLLHSVSLGKRSWLCLCLQCLAHSVCLAKEIIQTDFCSRLRP